MKIFKNRFGQIATLSVASIGAASAAVPASVTTALSDAASDSLTMGSAVLVVIVGIYALKLLRRAL